MSRFVLNRCTALITGASAGIGREFARQLAGRAATLVLVARRKARLEQLRAELGGNTRIAIRPVDLSAPEEVDALVEWLRSERLTVDLLINNAGLGDRGAFATSDPGRVHDVLMVNVAALTRLTLHLLPEMIAQKRGGILNVSSSASFVPMPGFAVYAATKAYVTSFSEALRAELRGTGVAVTALCPGPVHTEFQQVARRPGERERRIGPEFTHVPVERVVRAGLAAIEHDRPLVIPGVLMKLSMLLARLTPMPILRPFLPFAARQ